MKTVSNYLFELYKPYLQQLEGVAETSLDVYLNETALYGHSGGIKCIANAPALVVTTTFYSNYEWTGQLLPDMGSLKFKSCCRKEFPSYPRELEVVFLAKPGKETQDILQILKDSFNDFTNSK